MQDIGKNLKYMRQSRGLTQKNIGDLLGVSFQQVQKYESGANKLPIEHLFRLKNYYGTNYEAFFSGVNDRDSSMLKQEDIFEQIDTMKDKIFKRKILTAIQILILN